MKKENSFLRLLFFKHLYLNICSSWISSRANVLLSRITNLKGLYLIGNYTSNAIKTNKDVSKEYVLLRKDFLFIPDLRVTCKKTDLLITWLNIRSLWKHAIDILGDLRFRFNILSFAYSNISCLMKTFLTYP